MKIHIFKCLCGFFLIFLSLPGWAQTIVKAEYFFDKDPGAGKGMEIPLTASAQVDGETEVSTNGLSDGFHTLYIRFRDDQGSWSMSEGRSFLIQQQPQPPAIPPIVKAEYFVDTDPGLGQGTELSFTAGGQVDEFAELNTDGISLGFHTLYIRTMDNTGTWSLTEGRPFFMDKSLEALATIVAAEYFIDESNPIPGNGTAFEIEAGAIVDFETLMDVSGLALGEHRLNLRLQDSKGAWSYINTEEFTIANPRIDNISPKSGGNTGFVTVAILGASFDEGTTVKFSGNELADIIVPDSMISIINGDEILAMVDLKGKAVGLYNIELTLGDGTKISLPNSFSVEEGIEAAPWAEVLGFDRIRRGQWQTYTITYGNKGNVDALGVPLNIIIGLDTLAQVKLDFELDQPSSNGEDFPYDSISVFFNTDSLFNEPYLAKVYPLFISNIPANSVSTINIHIKTNVDIELLAYTDAPYYNDQKLKIIYPDAPFFEDEGRVGGIVAGRMAAASDININIYQEDCAAYLLSKIPHFVPGYNCMMSMFDLVVEGEQGKFTHKNRRVRIASFMWQFGKSTLDCALDVLPAGKLARMAAVAYKFARNVEDAQPCSNVMQQSYDALKKQTKKVRVVNSFDPNDKIGSVGSGSKNFVYGDAPFRYLIRFENKATATAAAQTVLIVDTLDVSKFDLSTFELGYFNFADRYLQVPPGNKNYTGYVDLRPEQELIVKIEAKLDESTGVLTWLYTSLDPTTRALTQNPDAGFLPPNKTAPEGDGGVFYTIRPKPGLMTNEDIKNRAYIYFDNNEVIPTPTWSNSIDKVPPVSQVTSLAEEQTSSTFTVNWSGSDEGAGISNYSIYVSENNKSFTLWLHKVTDTSALFEGKADSTYQFYSIARDSTGIMETAPEIADASTLVSIITGIEDELEKQVMVYPNPASHTITVKLAENIRQSRLSLIDMQGVVIMEVEAGDEKTVIPISQIAKGMYLLRVSAKDRLINLKVLIQ